MTVEDFIAHYGVKRRSGRYPWGSGDNPYQGDDDVAKLAKKRVGGKKISDVIPWYFKRSKSLMKNKELSVLEKMVAVYRVELEAQQLVIGDTPILEGLADKSLKMYDRIYGKPKKGGEGNDGG